MRDYAKLSPQFWIGHTGRKIRKQGAATQLVALYLMSSPHSNMLGVYYLPVLFIAHETGLSLEQAAASLESLCELGFCSYDADCEYVWVQEMAHYQIDSVLKPNDNRVKHINDTLQSFPTLSFLNDFYQRYQTSLCLAPMALVGNLSPSAASIKPLVSKEQEQENEQEKEKEQEQEDARAKDTVIPLTASVLSIPLLDNQEWQVCSAHIRAWQQAYPAIDILKTLQDIRNWNIANPHRRKVKTSIHKHITDWLAKEQQQQQQTKAPYYRTPSSVLEHNQAVGQQWLARSMAAESAGAQA